MKEKAFPTMRVCIFSMYRNGDFIRGGVPSERVRGYSPLIVIVTSWRGMVPVI